MENQVQEEKKTDFDTEKKVKEITNQLASFELENLPENLLDQILEKIKEHHKNAKLSDLIKILTKEDLKGGPKENS